MTDSDKESENEAHSAEECSFTSMEEWIEDNAGNFTSDEIAGCIYPQEYEE